MVRKFVALLFLQLFLLVGIFEQDPQCVAASHLFPSTETQFFYFNPDSSHTNLGRLKREMDAFLLRASVDLDFQPFARQRDFENQIRLIRPAFVLLPYWYYQMYGSELELEPLLQPVQNGEFTYTKVLLVQRDAPRDVKFLSKKNLAMTSMGPVTTNFLKDLLQRDVAGLKLNIITTSKDSDALFALALGQVEAAVVSRKNLEQFGLINPKLLKMVKPVAESSPIPLPLLCTTKGALSDAEVQRLKDIFLQTNRRTGSVKIMEMLHFDAWQMVHY